MGAGESLVKEAPDEAAPAVPMRTRVLMKGDVGVNGSPISKMADYPDIPGLIPLVQLAEDMFDEAGVRVKIGQYALLLDEDQLCNANTIPLLTKHWHAARGDFLIKVTRWPISAPSSRSAGSASVSAAELPRAEAPRGPRAEAVPHAEVAPPRRPGLMVCIDGTIGCGKTSLMRHLQHIQCGRLTSVQLTPEPIESWWSHLVDLYEVLKAEGEASQSPSGDATGSRRQLVVRNLEEAVWRHHAAIVEKCRQGFWVMTERGLRSQVEVFCQVLHGGRMLSDRDYDDFVQRYSQHKRVNQDLRCVTVYFRLDAKTALKRVHQRAEDEGRIFEKDMSLEYLTALCTRYDEIYGTTDSDSVIVVDANETREDLARCVGEKLCEKMAQIIREQADEDISDFKDLFKDRRMQPE